jgi:hypothetical protein
MQIMVRGYLASATTMAIICPYVVYSEDNNNKTHDNCLQTTQEYKTTDPQHRVLSCRSYIKSNGCNDRAYAIIAARHYDCCQCGTMMSIVDTHYMNE